MPDFVFHFHPGAWRHRLLDTHFAHLHRYSRCRVIILIVHFKHWSSKVAVRLEVHLISALAGSQLIPPSLSLHTFSWLLWLRLFWFECLDTYVHVLLHGLIRLSVVLLELHKISLSILDNRSKYFLEVITKFINFGELLNHIELRGIES